MKIGDIDLVKEMNLERDCTTCDGTGIVDVMLWHPTPKDTYPGKGACRECSGVGKLLTRNGQALFEFLRRHSGIGNGSVTTLKYYAPLKSNEVEISDAATE